jgi:predicted nucleic acid-binding protein
VTGIVIDASVTLSWCFPDEQTPMSLNVLDRLKAGERALVPSFWAVEVLNILLLGERKGRIAPDQTTAFLDTLRALNPRMDHVTLDQIAGPVQIICRDHRLTPYDALYIELALRSGFALATLDQPQKDAAQALGVQCL